MKKGQIITKNKIVYIKRSLSLLRNHFSVQLGTQTISFPKNPFKSDLSYPV